MDISKLPSPFYRGTVKALIMDDQKRLLVGRGEENDSSWEMPGGGLEHNESVEECIRRELKEELGAEVASIRQVAFIYRGRSIRGWMILRIAVPVQLKNYNFEFGDMKDAKFVTREELMALDFAADEGTVKSCADLIWPNN